jgi:hypothetical protein
MGHFMERASRAANTVARVAGAAHTAYQVGKGLYGLAQAAAPYAAMLL